jgi:hypothetical protein
MVLSDSLLTNTAQLLHHPIIIHDLPLRIESPNLKNRIAQLVALPKVTVSSHGKPGDSFTRTPPPDRIPLMELKKQVPLWARVIYGSCA